MRRLTFIEFMAMIFTALAAAATGVQAFVSWETRNEVARAIVFAERIDACTRVISAMEPLTERATVSWRESVAQSERDGINPTLFFSPMLAAPQNGGPTLHEQMLREWKRAATAFRLVMPLEDRQQIAYFDTQLRREMVRYESIPKAEFVAWLEAVDAAAAALEERCRRLI